MTTTSRRMPNIAAIVEANHALLARHPNAPLEPANACWACNLAGKPQRAHVVPRSGGGSDEPGNFFLLCNVCHREQPDGALRAQQERWLFDHESCHDRFMRYATPVVEAIARDVDVTRYDVEWLVLAFDLAKAEAFEVASQGGGAHHASNAMATFLGSTCGRPIAFVSYTVGEGGLRC